MLVVVVVVLVGRRRRRRRPARRPLYTMLGSPGVALWLSYVTRKKRLRPVHPVGWLVLR